MTRAQPVAATGATFTLSLARATLHRLAQVWIALKNRRQVSRLADLDDRCLKDIGLMRSDIDAALGTPLHCDPSHHLMGITGHHLSKPVGAGFSSVEMNLLRRPDAAVEPQRLGLAQG
jgi:uncharacterized protein YjiS (DUF1127 family)